MRRHAGMPRTRRGSPPASKYDEVGGPQKLNFFQSRVTKKIKTPKFHVTCSFYSRESKSLLPPPPSQWCSTPPPVSPRLHARSLAMHGNQLICHRRGMPPPPWSAVTVPDFFILRSSPRNIWQTTTQERYFFHFHHQISLVRLQC